MNDRNQCTPDNPMPKGSKGKWEHQEAYIVDCDDITSWKCKSCGHKWRSETPQ